VCKSEGKFSSRNSVVFVICGKKNSPRDGRKLELQQYHITVYETNTLSYGKVMETCMVPPLASHPPACNERTADPPAGHL